MKFSTAIVLVLAVIVLVGCQKEEPIRVIRAPKYEDVYASNHVANKGDDTSDSTEMPGPVKETDRMLAAMVPRGEQTWFFKVAGPKDAVTAQRDAMLTFLKSVKFGDGASEPTWELPEGWRKSPTARRSSMRFATIEIGEGDDALELTIIPLSIAEGNPVRAILSNVNRWRKQLRLSPLEVDELEEATEKIEVAGGTATMVDFVGELGDTGMQPPFANMGMNRPPRAAPPGPPPSPPKITYDVPEGWEKGRVGAMRHDAYEVHAGDESVEITVIPLNSSPLLDNLQRWQKEIGIEPVTADKLSDVVEELDVDGKRVEYVELVGENETTLAGILRDGERAWFIKLRGDKEVAAGEKQKFRAFVESFRLK